MLIRGGPRRVTNKPGRRRLLGLPSRLYGKKRMYNHALKQHTCNVMSAAMVEYLENGTLRVLYRCPKCSVQVIWLRAQLMFPGHRELVGRCDCPGKLHRFGLDLTGSVVT